MSEAGSYHIITYGCQMNLHDSEEMAAVLASIGYGPTAKEEEADIILLNTCSVREKAAQKVFSKLGRLKRLKRGKPDLVIGVCGCLGKQEGQNIFARAPYVDLVMGPGRIRNLGTMIVDIKQNGHRPILDIQEKDGSFPVGKDFDRSTSTKAYITIMEGCNNFCSYCVVPYLRGREICRPLQEIVDEISGQVDRGYGEFILLGQNVNSYRYGDTGFEDLLARIANLPGVVRVRFITSHPRDFTQAIGGLIRDMPPICNQVHLPVQSGSNKILRAMGRGYTREEYLEKIRWLRTHIPDICISTDMIVGFPGESMENFRDTIALMQEAAFESMFSFRYSPRPMTPASEMLDDVPFEEKTKRLSELQSLHRLIQMRSNREDEGKILEVLVEGFSKRGPADITGKTMTNKVVNFPGEAELIGKTVKVCIEHAGMNSLRGRLLRE